jgi:hypothetical protein
MDISEVRRRVQDTMRRARAAERERRERADAAGEAYARFLDRIAVPLCRQLVNVLRADGYGFTLGTPAAGVRLASDRSSDDVLELALDTSGGRPLVVGRTRRRVGGRVLESERAVNETGGIEELTEDDVLTFLLRELEPFVAK